MKEIIVKFAGKDWTLKTNNSFQVSSAPEELTETLRNAPRIGVSSKGMPVIEDENGKHVTLCAAKYRLETEKLYSGSSSSEPRVKAPVMPVQFARELVNLKGISKECKEYLENIIKAQDEIERQKKDTALKAMIAAGVPEAQAKTILGLD